MSKPQETKIEELASLALSEGKNLGCSDVSVIASKSDDSQVRFSNNSISLVNKVRNVTLSVYVSKDKKKMVGATYNPSEDGIKRFMKNLLASCLSLPPSEDYVPLPQGPFHYAYKPNFDSKILDAPLVDYTKQAIDAGLNAGGKRVSGSLTARTGEHFILTTGEASGSDRYSKLLLNVRAFADDNSSGQGLSCTSYLSDFKPENAGFTAGDYAKRSQNPKMLSEGKYKVIFAPTVVANILPVASNASAFAIDSGTSFLTDKLEQRIAVQTLRIEDHGSHPHGLGGESFDAEGTPTEDTEIVGDGTFRNMLHNVTTGKKFGKKSTGNAGIISPEPITTEFGNGGISTNDMIRETVDGVFITNNWYTRYQNYRNGEYSTVPRDAAFRIERGELTEPLAGLRVSDSIPRQLNNIEFISHERQWIQWWEVSVPTLAPAMMIKDVPLTRAVGN